MSRDGLLVYGAYGYTGELVARAAVARGRTPTLAGRDSGRLRSLADELGRPSIAFRLDERAAVRAALEDHEAVLNCAGPFVDTYEPLVEAAVETGTHYLDLTGEIGVFRGIREYGAAARDAGVTLLPGVGFDVVPTDCLAAHLAGRCPEADRLRLAFEADGGASPGTVRTVIRHLHEGGRVRRDGDLEAVPLAWKTETVDFGDGERTVVSIPWGDVATAYHTTGIPNVEVYTSMHPARVRWLRRLRYLSPVLARRPVQWLLARLLVEGDGPDATAREETGARVWGEAAGDGDRAVARLHTPNTYSLTVETALAAGARTVEGEAPSGFQTPAGAFGEAFVLEREGVELTDVTAPPPTQ